MPPAFPQISRRLLSAAACCLFTISVSAADYFVAPDGDDTAAGSLEAPFATLQHAQDAAEPGDTVYIRGGTYQMTEAHISGKVGIYSCVTMLSKSGEPGKPIRYCAYENERPVFDYSAVKPAGRRVTAFRVDGSWIHLKGFEVIGVQVTIKTHTQSICFDNQGSHNLYEQLSAHDGMGIGFWIGAGSHNLVLNCDAYRNTDPVSENGRGENVDGFGFHPKGTAEGNIFRGCRAWFNADDGFDFIHASSPVTAVNCWAFYNGYSTDFKSLANGNGFKAGGQAGVAVEKIPNPLPRHVVRDSLSVGNKANGFYANHHPGGLDFFQNSAFRNGTNFNLLGRDPKDNVTKIPGRGHRLENNLGFAARSKEVDQLNAAACEATHNSFTLPLKLTDSDFVSLDESQLTAPRQPDGSLPEIMLMHLNPGSAAIDAGKNLGRPFKGAAPDLGAFESGK